ncbi:LysR family transcriptional regulator [Vibrio hannami]|uniref:LysR family transcriptional regulator n=1 Tax=Vibrio hannami TaxID=2717094 RepID=UPI00240F1E9E|nr:LysR family transcriptional regulator [Vibrio hannami]MDG3084829.1 LysR family transcriptional regulator [Vibrio hannami]
MDLTSRLLLFLDVVERGSYAKAAELRLMDRSVVSKQVSKLEEELDVRLLNRTTRSFSLTSAGVEVKRKAEVLRENLRDTIQAAHNFHEKPKGLLKITTTTSVARNVLRNVIDDFQKKYPEVIIELRADNRIVDIVGEGFDIAFRSGDMQDSSLIAREIARNRPILLASPEFIKKHGEPITVEDLQKLPAGGYAADNFRSKALTYVDDDGQRQSVPMNLTFYSNDIDLVMHRALSGEVFCANMAAHVTDEITSGKLVPIMTDLKIPNFNPIYAVYPHRDMPIRTRLFLDAVREYIGEDVPVWEQNIPGFAEMYGQPTRKEWDK